jgi:Amt family ammonium transporter
MISWLVVEKIRHGHHTSLGAASGAVAGLVAITPSCANISPLAALGLGFVAGAACVVFVDLKFKFGFDDSLDVVGVHLGGGLIGTLALGFIALPVDGAGGGLFYGGGLHQLIAQTVAVLITVAVSGLGTAVIGLAIHKTLGFRVSREDELAGVDRSEHAETAYAFAELGFSRFSPFGHHVRPADTVRTPTAAHSAARAPENAPAPAPAKEDSLV